MYYPSKITKVLKLKPLSSYSFPGVLGKFPYRKISRLCIRLDSDRVEQDGWEKTFNLIINQMSLVQDDCRLQYTWNIYHGKLALKELEL